MNELIWSIFRLYSRFQKWVMKEYDRYRGRPAALKRAIRKAKRYNRKYKRRYKVYFLQHKYQVLTRIDIQVKKHEGVFVRYINATKMEPLAFFDTETNEPSDFAKELLNTKYKK